MRRPLCGLLTLAFASCLVTGCGSASGIKPGIPASTTVTPINPTPDMGPTPAPKTRK